MTPSAILSAKLTRRGLTPAALADLLSARGVEVTAATARNWITGRAVPRDAHRLPLVEVLALDRDDFLLACTTAAAAATPTPEP